MYYPYYPFEDDTMWRRIHHIAGVVTAIGTLVLTGSISVVLVADWFDQLASQLGGDLSPTDPITAVGGMLGLIVLILFGWGIAGMKR